MKNKLRKFWRWIKSFFVDQENPYEKLVMPTILNYAPRLVAKYVVGVQPLDLAHAVALRVRDRLFPPRNHSKLNEMCSIFADFKSIQRRPCMWSKIKKWFTKQPGVNVNTLAEQVKSLSTQMQLLIEERQAMIAEFQQIAFLLARLSEAEIKTIVCQDTAPNALKVLLVEELRERIKAEEAEKEAA